MRPQTVEYEYDRRTATKYRESAMFFLHGSISGTPAIPVQRLHRLNPHTTVFLFASLPTDQDKYCQSSQSWLLLSGHIGAGEEKWFSLPVGAKR